MFDIVKDAYNNYEDLKNVTLNDLVGIYIDLTNDDFLFFEKYNDFWTYEDKNGKYDYKIDSNSTVETLVNQLMQNYEFKEGWTIRVYGKQDNFIKFILPGNRKLMSQELFGHYELNRIRELNEEIYKDDPITLTNFRHQMNIVYNDVSELVRVISAQSHNDETLKLTMNMVQSILANIPLTDLTDDTISEKDWVDVNEIMDQTKLEPYIQLDDNHIIKNVYTNIRCTRIIKVVYENLEEDSDETVYFDINANIYIDTEDNNEAYFGKESIQNVDLPWSFKPINEIPFNDENKNLKNSMIKISELF